MSEKEINGMRTKGLGKDTLWNLLGMAFPVIVAIVTIPFIIKKLGTEKFGVLSLVWMLVGYFSIFDMGLGRALTRLSAARISDGRRDELPGLFWTAVSMMFCLGTLGGIIMVLLSRPLALRWLNISDIYRHEALFAFRMVALCMPVVVMTTGLTGFLEAVRKFKLVNLLRIPAGTYTFLAPAIALFFTTKFGVIVGVLVIGRTLECCAYFLGCIFAEMKIIRKIVFNKLEIAPLFTFGGWMTVSNLTVPLMQHIDRFIIGMIRHVAEVAFFATPAEMTVRMLVIARARVNVLFPEFVAGFTNKKKEVSLLFARSANSLLMIIFPFFWVVIIFAPEILRIWLGGDFAVKSTPVMVILSLGVMVHSVAMVSWFYVQGVGRPDLPALIHLCQLPLYIGVTSLLCLKWGIIGSSVAWTVRTVVDWFFMLFFARKFSDEKIASKTRTILPCLLYTSPSPRDS